MAKQKTPSAELLLTVEGRQLLRITQGGVFVRNRPIDGDAHDLFDALRSLIQQCHRTKVYRAGQKVIPK